MSTISMVNFETHMALTRLYADYALAVDSGHWDLWPEFFTEQCVYKLIPRENHERGFPLCTLSFTSKGMLKDRVYGIQETLYHDPYYQRHVVGAPVVQRIERVGADTRLEAIVALMRDAMSQRPALARTARSLNTGTAYSGRV